MRKRILALMMTSLMMIGAVAGGASAEEEKTKVVLNEVAHSIFYAPQYVAIEEGYFQEEGIKLDLVTGFGADKTMTAVLTGEADIGFMGPEASIFKWEDLKGKHILGGRKGGMPEMVFEYILKQNGIDPETDLDIDQSIDFGSTAAAFTSGQGDYTVEFEPSATLLEQQEGGYVIASLGVDSGYVPYTAYCARTDYMEEHPELIQGFTNAIQKGLDYVNSHTPEEIAQVIAPQFPETDLDTITAIVDRYQSQDTWKEDLVFEESSFDLLQDILESAGELETRASYEDLVVTEFAASAAEEK